MTKIQDAKNTNSKITKNSCL